MLGKIDGGKRRGQQRMRWLDGITNSMDMSWVNSGSWWWTGRPGMLQSMGLQRVGHDWATELNWIMLNVNNTNVPIIRQRLVGLFKKYITQLYAIYRKLGLASSASSKEPACQCRRHKGGGFDPWVRKIPWRRARQPTAVFLPGESHGQRSLEGYTVHSITKSQTWLKQPSTQA